MHRITVNGAPCGKDHIKNIPLGEFFLLEDSVGQEEILLRLPFTGREREGVIIAFSFDSHSFRLFPEHTTVTVVSAETQLFKQALG